MSAAYATAGLEVAAGLFAAVAVVCAIYTARGLFDAWKRRT